MEGQGSTVWAPEWAGAWSRWVCPREVQHEVRGEPRAGPGEAGGPGQQGLSHALERGHRPESQGAHRCHRPAGKTCVSELPPRVGA